ncbi:hypothetical protein PVAG01_04803 [Phlyctema vagabunda]|uniref:Uncharacterized protein n=1 Tax=Phlyctema vagabunda TaxID=108571 RepID=A0ABR4PI91_9HELO
METFYRDLLHEKVSGKISLKAPKAQGDYFVGILSADKHPSRFESTDFFWTKVKPKHTVKQIRAVYLERKGCHVLLSDGDRVLEDRTRFETLNLFGDELIVLWAQSQRAPQPLLADDHKRSPSALPESRTTKSVARESSYDSRSSFKRALESPLTPGSSKRFKSSSPVRSNVGENDFPTKRDVATWSPGPTEMSSQNSVHSIVASETNSESIPTNSADKTFDIVTARVPLPTSAASVISSDDPQPENDRSPNRNTTFQDTLTPADSPKDPVKLGSEATIIAISKPEPTNDPTSLLSSSMFPNLTKPSRESAQDFQPRAKAKSPAQQNSLFHYFNKITPDPDDKSNGT